MVKKHPLNRQLILKSLRPDFESALVAGLADLKITPTAQLVGRLIDYTALLQQWGGSYNLIAKLDLETILVRHLLDSLSVAPWIVGPRVLDVGSGAGLPGIPLALALPDCHFVLLDSSHKKTVFLNQVVLTLKLPNVTVVTERIEKFQTEQLFATVVTRAVAKLGEIYPSAWRLVVVSGVLLLMKGCYPMPDELSVAPTAQVYPLEVPYLTEERHLIRVGKSLPN